MWIDDQIIQHCNQSLYAKCFFPKEHLVVCGRSEKPEIEANQKKCSEDNISVTKRRGGGGTVLLGPGTLVVSLGVWVKDYYKNKFYFEKINQAVIDAIGKINPDTMGKLSQNGISDIVCGAKKIAGTSMYRSRNFLLYQGSVLVNADIQKITDYIHHPTREPEYRKARKHEDFLVNLSDISPLKSGFDLFEQQFTLHVEASLHQDIISPVEKQVHYLLNKI